ncbi:MAG: hypothetical protein ACK57P_04530 [Planctomycetota bacterium]
MAPVEVVIAVIEYCWLQQNGPVRVDVVIEESSSDSLVDAMVGRGGVLVHAPSKSNDAIQPPARDCARVDVEDAWIGIEEATMRCIIKDSQGAVQTF